MKQILYRENYDIFYIYIFGNMDYYLYNSNKNTRGGATYKKAKREESGMG